MTQLSIDSEQAPSLVDWPNAPTVRDLRNDLTEARGFHDDHVQKVNKWLDYLRGKVNFPIREGRSRVVPKLIRKQNEWRYTSLEEPFLSSNDMFKVNPATHLDVEAAEQNQKILNKQFRVDIDRVKFINQYIRTAVNTGTAIVKVNWNVEYGKVREEVPVYTETPEETMAAIAQLVQTGQLDEQSAQQMLMSGQPIQIGVESKLVDAEISNKPVLQVKDCRDVIIDPSCEGDIDKAQFIIDVFLSDMSTLKKDGRYSNLEYINVDAESVTTSDYTFSFDYKNEATGGMTFNDKPRKKLIVYEYWGYWDINGDGITRPIVASWIGDTMIRLEENPYPDKKLPYVVVQYLLPEENSMIYGDSDASLLMDNQDIIGAVTRSMIDLIGRSANAQLGVRKDILDQPNRAKFNRGEDYEFNVVNNINDAFYVHKMPDIPRSALEVIQLQNNEAEALTGVKAFSGGINSDAYGQVVQGIKSATDATSKREISILRRLSDGIRKIGQKIIAMNSVWLPDENILRTTDDEFVTIKRSDLAGNFDLELEVSTAELDNQKASDLSFMLQTIGNSMPMEMTQLILSKIATLRKMPDLARQIRDYQPPPPDPMVVENQQLQNAMLEAQVKNENAKAGENQVDIDLKHWKAESERAKAENLKASARKTNSEADQKDLDFVEQATGLKQERKLEEQLLGSYTKEDAKRQSGAYNNKKGRAVDR